MISRYKRNLWEKNVWDAFVGGFKLIPYNLGAGADEGDAFGCMLQWFVVTPIHFVLLPFTLSIGAGIKTLIDINTRQTPSSEGETEEQCKLIENLSHDDLSTLSHRITALKPFSISSTQLCNNLIK